MHGERSLRAFARAVDLILDGPEPEPERVRCCGCGASILEADAYYIGESPNCDECYYDHPTVRGRDLRAIGAGVSSRDFLSR